MAKPELFTEFKIEKDNGKIKINNVSYNEIQNNYFAKITPFESVCLPRKILNENEMEISKEKINKIIKEILRCSICYEIFEDPVNIKNCLHKFCKKCIGDYNRKFKKECALCRHQVETKRLMKDDDKIKQIIECIIPDIDKFNKAEEKIFISKVKEFVFKDKERFKKQIENTRIEDEKEKKNKIKNKNMNYSTIFNNNIIITNNSNNNNNNNNDNNINNNENNKNDNNNNNNNDNNNTNKFLNLPPKINNNLNISETNNIINKDKKRENESTFINKKRHFELSYDDANNILNTLNEGTNILIKLNCGEKFEGIQKFFEKTRIKLEDTYTLEFITRFIGYKQNLKPEQLKKIDFYTLESDNKQKEWKDHDTLIKTIVEYDKTHNTNIDMSDINYGFSKPNGCEYILNLYFVFSSTKLNI